VRRSGLLTAFLLGLVTILTQTILIRELMIEAGLLELVAVLALALWMLFTGIGALLFRFLPRQISSPPVGLLALFLCFFGQLFSIRPLASLFAPVTGMALSIPAMVTVTVGVLLPGCLLGGLLFPACVAAEEKRGSTLRVYLLESFGMAIGAGLFYLFPSVFSPVSYDLYRDHYAGRYHPDTLLLSRDGRSGRLDVVERNGQTAFFWNGHAVGVRGPDRQVETFARLALLQHPAPKRILLLGGLVSGNAAEVARVAPEAAVTVIEPEPKLADIFPFPIEEKNLTLLTGDPISLLERLPPHDLVVIDLPEPDSLATARLYTREFFRRILASQGSAAVLVVGLPGGQGMIPPELADLNASVKRVLEEVFAEVRLIPAGRHLLVAGNPSMISDDSSVLSQRLLNRKLGTTWVNEALLRDILEPMHLQLTTEAVERSPASPNRILAPTVVFASLRHAARRLDRPLSPVLVNLPERPFTFFGVAFAVVGLVFSLVVFAARRELDWRDSLVIFTSSGSAFTIEVAILSLFQNFVGQIYHFIALFTVSFTGGLVLGLQGASRFRLPASYLLGALALAATLLLIAAPTPLTAGAYISINFVLGLLLGGALGLLARRNRSDRESGIGFYLADLSGAAVCGLLFGAAVIPLYEVGYSLVAAGILSLFGMFAALRRP